MLLIPPCAPCLHTLVRLWPARPLPSKQHNSMPHKPAPQLHSCGLTMWVKSAPKRYIQLRRFPPAIPALRAHFTRACIEETDHLAWTAQRLKELNARPSLLNPLWYAGAFGLGLIAGRLGDAVSLGFVVETEAQVGAHLQSHLERLPESDHASRAIVAQMRDDELRHAQDATDAGPWNYPKRSRT
jgi:hypothetical protein